MATTITSGGVTRTPLQVLGYRSERTSGNILHPVLGSTSQDVTLRAAGLRSGTLELLALTMADALNLEALHLNAATVTLADTDIPSGGFTYVASGRIAVELEDETRSLWTVSIEFQEITV